MKKKKIWIRIGAILSAVLCIALLAVPCFADVKITENGSNYTIDSWDEPIGSVTVPASVRLEDTGASVSLRGLYGFVFKKYLEANIGDPFPGDHMNVSFMRYIRIEDKYYTFSRFENTDYGLALRVDEELIPVYYFSSSNEQPDYMIFISEYPFELGGSTSARAYANYGFDVYTVNIEGDSGSTPSVESGGILGVWSVIMTWITTALASVQAVFFVNGSLTFLGILAIIGVSIALGLLIIGIVTRFLQLRG